MSKAKSRWSILRNAIVHKQLPEKNDNEFIDSVRCFSSFDLFKVSPCDDMSGISPPFKKNVRYSEWMWYTCKHVETTPVLIKNPVEEGVDLSVCYIV